MMQTIAIVNEKGGSGKTTTAVNLSAALGELGRKVLLVDLDGQAASSRWLGVEDDTSFADALWSGKGFHPVPDVAPGVSLAPGSGKLDSVAHDLRPTQGGQLHKLLTEISGFDYGVIDCPPSLGNRLIGNALLAATHAIVPVETSILALDGLKILLTTLQDVRDGFGHEIVLAGVLACRYDARTKLSQLVLEELKRALPGKVFQTVIRENVRVRECPGSGQSILTFASDSHAAEDYRSLAREVLAALGDPIGAADAPAEQEHLSFAEMRKQTDAILREYSLKYGVEVPPSEPPIIAELSAAAVEPTWESSGEETAGPAEPPAVEQVEPSQQAPPVETDEAPAEPPAAEQVEPGQEAPPVETDEAPAEPPAAEQVEPSQEAPPVETDEAPAEAPPQETPADDLGYPPGSGSSEEPQSQDNPYEGTDWAKGETPPAAEDSQEDVQSRQAEAAEPDDSADAEPVPEPVPAVENTDDEPAADEKVDYPALRAMLQKLSG